MLQFYNDQVKTKDNRTHDQVKSKDNMTTHKPRFWNNPTNNKDNRTLKLLFQSDSTLKLNDHMEYKDADLAFFRYESISLHLHKQINKIS